MPRITPNLWFDTESKEAAEFYVSVFPNSKITAVTHYGEAGPREAGMVLDRRLRARRPALYGHQRRPGLPLQRGDLAADRVRRPGRGRLLLEQALRGRRGRPLRLAQGPLRPVLAGVPGRYGRIAQRSRPGARAAGDEGHARHAEDRHRRHPRGGRRGLTASRQPQIALARARALSASDLSVAYGSPAMSPAMRVSGVRGCESRYVRLASCFTRDAMK